MGQLDSTCRVPPRSTPSPLSCCVPCSIIAAVYRHKLTHWKGQTLKPGFHVIGGARVVSNQAVSSDGEVNCIRRVHGPTAAAAAAEAALTLSTAM
jgi:hypothetical protein